MRYQLFFELEVRHQYMEDRPQREWIIVPDASTSKILNGSYFLAKPAANGLTICKPVMDEKDTGPAITSNEVFGFMIFPTSQRFAEFTDEQLSEGHIRLFTNEGLQKGSFDLVRSETSSQRKFNGFSAVGRVEVRAKDVKAGAGGQSPVYQAVFQAKAIKWKYYLVKKKDTADLTIKGPTGELAFKKIAVSEDSSDKIVQSLMISYPETQVEVFESTKAITCTNEGIRKIRLFQNGNVIIENLPNPDPAHNGIEIIQLR